MRKIILLFSLITCFSANSLEAQFVLPKVTVTGNEQPITSDDGAAVLTAKLDKSSTPPNLVKVKYRWVIIDAGKVRKNVAVWPDGSQVFFGVGSRPRSITVVLWVGCLYETLDDKGVIKQADVDFADPIISTVVVQGDPPIPPAPDPKPTPTPVVPVPTNTLPDGRFKVAQKAYDLVMQDVPLTSRSACPSLSTSFSGVASSIADGTLSDPTAIFKALADTNTAALNKVKVPVNDWAQWNKLYGDFIYDLYDKGQLKVNQDWQDLLNETATGLAAVK